MLPVSDLFQTAIKADDAFHEACVKQFGRDACNKRYQPKLFNKATRAAYEAFRLATAAYIATLNPRDTEDAEVAFFL